MLKRDRSNRGTWWTLKRRRWAYGVLVALGAAATGLGLGSAEQTGYIVAVGGALLGVAGLAVAHPTAE